MALLEFHPFRAWRALWSKAAPAPPGPRTNDLKGAYLDLVATLKAQAPHDKAMELAVGGGRSA